MAIKFYSDLFQAGNCNLGRESEILRGLTRIDEAMATSLDSRISYDELSNLKGSGTKVQRTRLTRYISPTALNDLRLKLLNTVNHVFDILFVMSVR